MGFLYIWDLGCSSGIGFSKLKLNVSVFLSRVRTIQDPSKESIRN